MLETLDLYKENTGFRCMHRVRAAVFSCVGREEGAASAFGEEGGWRWRHSESQDRGGGSINFRESVIGLS